MSVNMYVNGVQKTLAESTDVPSNFEDTSYTVHHEIPVSGESDSTVYAVMGVVIPKGKNAKVTVSSDISYTTDNIQVFYDDQALYTTIDSGSNGRLYNNPVTVSVPDGNTFAIQVRVQLNHIASTSGNVDITVVFDGGAIITGMNNVLPYKPGRNLIDPSFLFTHVGLDNQGADYITKFTSDVTLGWVPIGAGESVAFNKPTSAMAITSCLFDGAFDHTEKLSGKQTITNESESDGYVVFHINTSDASDLIAVSGIYPTDFIKYNPIGGYTENPVSGTYGTIGMYYPDEAERAGWIDDSQKTGRVRFVHISDTHPGNNATNPLAYADEFTDLSEANFLTLTGDLVNNDISNDFTKTADKINAMDKPCYICMGNHDVWNDSASTQRYTKYFNPIAEHNGLEDDISYYSVDFATEKVKCIWLDIYELSSSTPSHILSSTQINWFFSELDDAITNAYHVVVFLHDHFSPLGRVIDSFTDYDGVSSVISALKWIPDTIQAFKSGGSVSFTHNSGSYSHTFTGTGVFVAYFTGHAHRDRVGWLKDYDDQFCVTVTRAWITNEGGTIVNEKLGCAFNYVAIDSGNRKLSVMRIGNNNTIYGTKRTAFSISY